MSAYYFASLSPDAIRTGNFSRAPGPQPQCALPVPARCAWLNDAKQWACQGERGIEYYACNNGPYGLRNYDATSGPLGPPIFMRNQ